MSEMIQVPDGWEVKQSSELCNGIADGTHDTPQPSFFGFKLVTSKNLKDNKLDFEDCYLISEEDYDAINKRSQVKQFDILFGMIGTIGNPVIILDKKIDFAIKNVGLFRFNGDYELAKWFYYYLSSEQFKNYLDFILSGSSQKFVSLSMLRTLPILFPKEKKEQEKITKILSTLDKSIESTNRLIEKEKNIKKALMQELLTNGIDKDGHIRSPQAHTYKESELGLIPEEWEVVSLEKLISKVIDFRGKTPLKIGMDWGNGLIPSLSANNVQMGKVDFSKETHFGSEELYNVWMNKGATQKDDILFTMEAPLGNVALIPDDNKYILSQRVILLRIGKKIISHYMYYQMMSDDFQTRIFKYSSGSTVKGIQYSQLKEMLIAFPKDIEEQKQIAKILTTQDKKIEKEETNLAKLKELKKGLMSDLLSGKVRVKV